MRFWEGGRQEGSTTASGCPQLTSSRALGRDGAEDKAARGRGGRWGPKFLPALPRLLLVQSARQPRRAPRELLGLPRKPRFPGLGQGRGGARACLLAPRSLLLAPAVSTAGERGALALLLDRREPRPTRRAQGAAFHLPVGRAVRVAREAGWVGVGGEEGGWAPETEGSQGRSWQLFGPLEKVGSGSPAGVADFYCIDLQGRVTLLAWVWKGQNGTSKHFCGRRLSAQSLRPAWFQAPCSGFDGFSRFLKSAPAEDPLPNLTKLGCSMKAPSTLCSERTCRDCPGKSRVAAFYPCPAHLAGTARWGGICYRPLRN